MSKFEVSDTVNSNIYIYKIEILSSPYSELEKAVKNTISDIVCAISDTCAQVFDYFTVS